jgi:hypothetical protein
MRKLDTPQITLNALYCACVNGVGDPNLQTTYMADFHNIQTEANKYFAMAQTEQLYTLQQTKAPRGTDPIVVGALKKSQLKELYTYYMVPKEKPARIMYDTILCYAPDYFGGNSINYPTLLNGYFSNKTLN